MALKDLIVRGPMPPVPKPHKATRKRGRPKTRPLVKKTYRTRNHKLDPQPIDQETWFYEGRKGLLIVHEIRDDTGLWIRTDQFIVPWRMVMASAQRHQLRPPGGGGGT